MARTYYKSIRLEVDDASTFWTIIDLLRVAAIAEVPNLRFTRMEIMTEQGARVDDLAHLRPHDKLALPRSLEVSGTHDGIVTKLAYRAGQTLDLSVEAPRELIAIGLIEVLKTAIGRSKTNAPRKTIAGILPPKRLLTVSLVLGLALFVGGVGLFSWTIKAASSESYPFFFTGRNLPLSLPLAGTLLLTSFGSFLLGGALEKKWGTISTFPFNRKSAVLDRRSRRKTGG